MCRPSATSPGASSAGYTIELAESEPGTHLARLFRRAKALQDVLGEHQDASVAEARIRSLVARPQSIRWSLAAGRLIEHQWARRETARAAFPAAWAALDKESRAVFVRITR